jgi:exosome complex exonuclease RRP6
MQLSTRTTDYIVDTLELREHLNCLNEVFTDPTIIKVMHGADWDIPWLQRDFGLYVVNLFDTGQASRVLGLPKLSLAFLLNYCCNVTANKGYQLADWRIRPLPEKMIKYAREDTHYLLYIYDRMRNELIRRGNSLSNLITVVLKNSKEICLKQYEKQVYDEKGYKKLCRKFRRSLKPQQVYCLQLLHKWRFDLARQEDESTGYVLPDHMMFQLAEILPREIEGIIACCTPVPTLLRQQIQEVNRLIQIARNTTDMYIIENVPVIVESSSAGGGGGDTAVDGHGSDDDDDDGGIDQVIEISGPPVLAKDPVISIMAKPLSTLPSEVEKVFSKIQEGFKQMLSIYTQPSMAPPDHLINHYMAAQMSSAKEDTPIKATTPKLGQKRKSSSNNEESGKKVSKVETPIGGERTDKGKQAKINERPQKHPQDIPDFQPFDFALNTFSSLTKVQDNTSKSKSSKKTFKKPPKSKSKRSSSNKSGTFKKTN